MKAYFVDRQDLTQENILVEVMENYGWTAEKTLRIVHSDVATDDVKEEINYYRQLGVAGSSFLYFQSEICYFGSSTCGSFAEIIEKVSAKMEVEMVIGKVCDIDGGNC